MQHSFDGRIENKHHHLIEIEIVARQIEEDFMEFASMDSILEEVFAPYQYQYLNEFTEFGGDTSIEHLGEVFYLKVKDALERQHWKFARFEISETPLRVYAIVEETF
jgi:6-pyruvoyl tetrahydropterin synthase-like protein